MKIPIPKPALPVEASDDAERMETFDAIGRRLNKVIPAPQELPPAIKELLAELERQEGADIRR